MSCPRCGDVCHCDSEFRPSHALARNARRRFELDDLPPIETTALIDPEAYDASEEQFSASLEQSAAPRSRFILDPNETAASTQEARSEPALACAPTPEATSVTITSEIAVSAEPEADSAPLRTMVESPADTQVEAAPESWKDEVSARLNSYRSRRKPKPPRYPSLRLKFDVPESRTYTRPAESALPAALPDNPAPENFEPEIQAEPEPEPVQPERQMMWPPLETGRLIEFPRSLYAPVVATDELAEPVAPAPRILEVPDVTPPLPALGGISLPAEEKEPERRPGFEIPLLAAPMSRRVFAMGIDAAVVGLAAALFGYIVFKIGGAITPSLSAIESLGVVFALLAAGYQYLLLIYTGSTPGLRLAHLRLSRFDGSPVPRRVRKWRVLASVLSAGSLGLGFAWSCLDEDALCWHDRITRTYLAPTR